MSEINNEKVENLLNEIKEQLDTDTKVSETIAKNADKLIEAQVEKFDTLSKAVDELSGKLASLTEMFANLNIPSQEDIEKHIEDKANELAKSFDEKVEAIEKSVETTKVENEELVKKVEELENEPVVKSTVEVEENPSNIAEERVEAPVVETRQDLISKALNELPTATPVRKSALFKAISQLEAGVSLQEIKL
jgi:ABC-type transporter Mla subunit MlaD